VAHSGDATRRRQWNKPARRGSQCRSSSTSIRPGQTSFTSDCSRDHSFLLPRFQLRLCRLRAPGRS
jgi:hypothetical protein